MNIKDAGHLDLMEYAEQPGFPNVFQFAKSIGICEGPNFVYKDRNGVPKGADVLVRMAEFANAAQKSTTKPASSKFILFYLCPNFLSYDKVDAECSRLMKKYNAFHSDTASITEVEAMSVVLMALYGYEQRKLCIARRYASYHNSQQQAKGSVWRLTTTEEYMRYHLDCIVHDKATGAIIGGCQLERRPEYFDVLEFRVEGKKMTEFQKHDIDDNRRALNRFLEDNPRAAIVLFAYSGNIDKFHMRSCGQYTVVDPLF